jgi:glycosyltransferase involved in cell wall biosynthesis
VTPTPTPLQVVLATHWMPWDRMGGTEVHCHSLAEALARMPGVRVAVVGYSHGQPSVPPGYAWADLATPWLRFLDRWQARGNPVAHWLHEAAFNRRAVRLARRLGADVLHRQAATPFRIRAPMPVVVTLHRSNLPVDDATPAGLAHRLLRPAAALLRSLRTRGLRRSLQAADAVIAVSEHAVANVLGRLGVRRAGPHRDAFVVSNGCPRVADPPGKAEARRRLGLAARATVVLFLGRLHPEKRVVRLLGLLAPELGQAGPSRVIVALAGTGPLLGDLQALAATRPGLRVPGFVDEQAKLDWLAAADVVALPSGVFETQPILLLEALRLGTPVYGTYADWLPADLQRFGRFGQDVRLALEAIDIDARGASALVPTWDQVAADTLEVYRQILRARDLGRTRRRSL